MGKARLEAFSDGVIAIIITIMVLELKVPHGVSMEALAPLRPVFLGYALSFVYVGIYWVNHHQLLHSAQTVSRLALWANLHLLFWLSLIPFTTAYMGEHPQEALPSAMYGAVLFMCSVAYLLLARALHAQGSQRKAWLSIAAYAAATGLSLWQPLAGAAVYVVIAALWLVPAAADDQGRG